MGERARLVVAALDGREDVAERLLAADPALSDGGDVALVLGDVAGVAHDPEATRLLLEQGASTATEWCS